jgi:prepilin-type N-terminal cleavage/methylation domain-containing protein
MNIKKVLCKKIFASSAGFTLVELMVGLSLTGLVMMGAMSLFLQSVRQFQDGSEHISFVDEARAAEQKVSNIIQYARATSVTPGSQDSLEIVQPDLTSSRLYFEAGDTPALDRLIYDPDISVSDDEQVIATYVRSIDDTPMFEVIADTNNTTNISFYVGLRPPETGTATAGYRKSYTGAIIHMTASPRNIVDYIQQ